VLQDNIEASPALAEALKQHVKTSLLPVKYPRWIEFIAELPKTATGKIQRYRLREQLAKQAERDLKGRANDGAGQN
jgi:benzoate-CoA ligase